MNATVANIEPQPQVAISRAPVLSYSSSIDDNYYSPPTDGGTTVSTGHYKSFSQYGRHNDDISYQDFEF